MWRKLTKEHQIEVTKRMVASVDESSRLKKMEETSREKVNKLKELLAEKEKEM